MQGLFGQPLLAPKTTMRAWTRYCGKAIYEAASRHIVRVSPAYRGDGTGAASAAAGKHALARPEWPSLRAVH